MRYLFAILALATSALCSTNSMLNADQYTRVTGISGIVARIDTEAFRSNIPKYNISFTSSGEASSGPRIVGIMIIVVSNAADWMTGFSFGGPDGSVNVLSTSTSLGMKFLVDSSVISDITETSELDNNGTKLGRFYNIVLQPGVGDHNRVMLSAHPYTSKYWDDGAGTNTVVLRASEFDSSKFADDYSILYSKTVANTNMFTISSETTPEITICVAIFM